MDYELSRLNPRTFEHLIQGIGTKVLGPGLIIFGDGPDGGREAAMEAEVPYPTASDRWSGSIVLQAKFRQRPEGTSADGPWAIAQLKAELDSYGDPDTNRELPDFLIFATNVTLSPSKDSGAKDQMFELARRCGLKGFDVWDYDKLRVWLDGSDDLRRSFSAYILPGDVITDTVEALAALGADRPDFSDSIGRFLQKELLADQWANLEQAGRAADEQVPVSRVFVDLPFGSSQQVDPPFEDSENLTPGIVAHVIEASSERLDPQTLSSQQSIRQSSRADHREMGSGRIVVLGGPGQGKSTVGQFVCQLFRATLLRSRPASSLSPDVRDALSTLEQHCESDGISPPTVKRFPLRVELSKFAEELNASSGANSLLDYLAGMITSRIPGTVSSPQMASWLGAYPWVLVLDGLDEVPASSNREALMAAIKDFWVDTSQDNADCLVIATTRPQGYDEDFSPEYYRHLWLAPLSTARAMHYANRLLELRILDDPERRSSVRTRLERAAARVDTARLMTSPLQVTIMATLLERMGQPPEGRWNLFSQYYRVIYDRELERDIPAASVLRDYKPDIDAIHERVGLLLQAESESAQGVDALMPRVRFAEVVKSRLREEEHDFAGNERLVEQIIETAMDRLVFLVGVEADQVGFEIRSLQEFMAAEALLDGGEEIVVERLRRIAALPAWRNVFLFAAGRCFADLQHLRSHIQTICAELNDPASHDLVGLALPGAKLAIDLLADGVANRQPRYERLLGREALRILRRPPALADDRLAEIYSPVHEENFKSELRAALEVQHFAGALAAWRTLSALSGRGHKWAIEMLTENPPGDGDLPDLIQALPGRHGPEVGELLARFVSTAAPDDSLRFPGKLQAFEMLDSTPGWYQAAFALIHEPRDGKRIQFEDWHPSEPIFEVRSVTLDGDKLQNDLRTFCAAGDLLPDSWATLHALLEFSLRPSQDFLADQLDRIANLSGRPEDLRPFWVYAAWPLASLVGMRPTTSDLAAAAAAAREGAFGGLDDWVEAEARWQAAPVTLADLAHPRSSTIEFDRDIGRIGFPFGVATVTAANNRVGMAGVILGWLDVIEQQSNRQFVTHLIFWLLGGDVSDGEVPQLSGRKICDAIKPADLEDGFTLNIEAMGEIEWMSPLEDAEIQFLDAVGRRFDEFSPDEELSLSLTKELLRAWRDQPDREGLYRLLAAGMKANIGSDALGLLGDQNEDPCARALLKIKLGEDLQESDLRALASGPTPWLAAAIAALGKFADRQHAGLALTRLDSLISAQRWTQRSEIDLLASELISRRSSGLSEPDVWEDLGLFSRPTGD